MVIGRLFIKKDLLGEDLECFSQLNLCHIVDLKFNNTFMNICQRKISLS